MKLLNWIIESNEMNSTEDDSLELIESLVDDVQGESDNGSKTSLGGCKTEVDAALEEDTTVTLSTHSPQTENDEPTEEFFIGEMDPSSHEDDDYLYEELIENCPEDVKMEVIDNSPPNFEAVVMNTEDGTVNKDPKNPLKLSTSHEEELVVMAIKLNSAVKGIKWYYQTYRPDDFKRHNDKRDWTKNCRLHRSVVHLLMKKFNKTGYHRLRNIKVIGQLARPKEGINSLQTITLTEYQKNILVHTAFTNAGGAQEAIKARLKIKRFINF